MGDRVARRGLRTAAATRGQQPHEPAASPVRTPTPSDAGAPSAPLSWRRRASQPDDSEPLQQQRRQGPTHRRWRSPSAAGKAPVRRWDAQQRDGPTTHPLHSNHHKAAPPAGYSRNSTPEPGSSTSSSGGRQPQRDKVVGFRKLEELAKDDGVRLLEKLADAATMDAFERLTRDSAELPDDWLRLVVTILAKLCQVEYTPIVLPLFQRACQKQFLDQVLLHVVRLSADTDAQRRGAVGRFYADLCVLCRGVVRKLPDVACEKLEVLVRKSAQELEDLPPFDGADRVREELLLLKADIRLEKERLARAAAVASAPPGGAAARRARPDCSGPPPECFRDLTAFPTADDLVVPHRPYLRENKVTGPYDDVEHYLDVQFRLMREDFVGPLRDGVHEYGRKLLELPAGAKRSNIRVNNIRVYEEVKFLSMKAEEDRMGLELCFDPHKKWAAGVNWEFSKRFMAGSLLVLTRDETFSAITLVTVCRRRNGDLQQGRVLVELCEGCVQEDLFTGHFLMAECQVYFGPYAHVLGALKEFHEGNLPLKEYLVYGSSASQPPTYLAGSNGSGYLYLPLRAAHPASLSGEAWPVQLDNDSSWPAADALGLDDSQFEAFKGAVTNKLMLVQGPPGTGKTFIGLKVAACLLRNRALWSPPARPRPLLVVCYTNHALDQFLTGLLPATEKMVRVGGGCKEPLLEPHTINNLRRNGRLPQQKELYRRLREHREKFYHVKQMSEGLRRCHSLLVDGEGVVDHHTLFRHGILSAGQCAFFERSETSAAVANWLLGEEDGWVEDAMEVVLNPADWDLSTVEGKNCFAPLSVVTLVPSTTQLEALLQALREKGEAAYGEEVAHLTGVLGELRQRGRLGGDAAAAAETTTPLDPENKLSSYGPQRRWQIYRGWVRELLQVHVEPALDQVDKEYAAAATRLQQWRLVEDQAIMASNEVIGMTTSYAASRQQILKQLKPSIVIVEEAAEVFESHVLSSLAGDVEHLIMIGDHKQLRPSPAVYDLAHSYHLDVSLFERLVNNGVRCASLGTQHRMRPEVAALICPVIYPSLTNHPSVQRFPDVRGVAKNVFFVDHSHPEERLQDAKSFLNKHEAHFVLSLARYLLRQGYDPSRITVLCTYKGQQYYLSQLRREDGLLKDVRVTVVDNYQGEECDVILLSLVRSNEDDAVGFLKTENRVCVALSRARHGLYVIGNMANMTAEGAVWREVRAQLSRQGALGSALPLRCEVHGTARAAACEADFKAYCPQGGCTKLCDAAMPCGHRCQQVCHVLDREHADVRCTEPCPKEACSKGHPCLGRCYEPCRPCEVPKVEQLLCLHLAEMPCHKDPHEHQCQVVFRVALPACGHERDAKCYQRVRLDTLPCRRPCEVPLGKCGHECSKFCHVLQDPDHKEYKCRKPCERTRPACTAEPQHSCKKECHLECGDCDVLVEKLLPSCGHKYKMRCKDDPAEKLCEYRCTRTLPDCGHRCVNKLCHQPCAPCRIKVRKTVPQCDHEQEMECGLDAALFTRCDAPCARALPCGHACTLRCAQPCEDAVCEQTVRMPAACGHGVALPCHQRDGLDQSSPELLRRCREQCAVPMACGHGCGQRCHILSDPDHQKVVCRRPCARTRTGCTLDHACGKLCCEPCQDCDVPVRKALACGHESPMRCRDDPSLVECAAECTRTRQPCGHQCGKRCSEPCDPCPEKVTKTVPQCGHEQEMECGLDVALFERCDAPCARALPCGHACTLRCAQPCEDAVCKQTVRMPAACGHDVALPCFTRSAVAPNHPAVLDLCSEPCGRRLQCGHTCPGTCGECLQGRLHVACKAAVCGRTLPCGHKCNEPCAASCPPCPQQCPVEFAHSVDTEMLNVVRESLHTTALFPQGFHRAAQLVLNAQQAVESLVKDHQGGSEGDPKASGSSAAKLECLYQYACVLKTLSSIVDSAWSQKDQEGNPGMTEPGKKELLNYVEHLSAHLLGHCVFLLSEQEASDINLELERTHRLAQLCLVEGGAGFASLSADERDMHDCISEAVRTVKPFAKNQHKFVKTMLQTLLKSVNVVFKDPDVHAVVATAGNRHHRN